MARSPFPTGDFGARTSGGLPGGDVGAPAAGAVGDLGRAARQFGARVRDMADRAYVREGQADAAGAIRNMREFGLEPSLPDGHGVREEAFKTAVRGQLLAERQAAYIGQMGEVETAHPASETEFASARQAVRAAFTPTGDAETDLAFERFVTVQDAEALGRVRGRQEGVRRDTVRGAFITSATTARTVLGQSVANAGLSEEGDALVGASLSQFAGQLSRFGPREAFSIGGIEFAADPARAAVVSAEEMGRLFGEVQAETRVNWILTAGQRAPDAASKLAFAGQVQERWAAGDPMFAGLDAADMGRLSARLEAEAQSAAVGERAAVTAAGERARDLMRALEYGGDVDPAEIRAAARASGDPGLMAEADYRLTYGFQVSPRENNAPGGFGAPGTGGAVGAGFGPWVGVLLDQMEGPGLVPDDNGRGRAQYGITEASHPEAWADGRIDRAEAAGIYKRQYWDAIGGDSLSPDLAFAAASAAVVGGVGTARELLSQANGDVDRFLSLEEARFRRLAAENPAKYGDDLPGWLNRLGRVRGAIGGMRAQRRAAEGYASDPIGYARGTANRPALAPVAEFDPGAPFGGDVAAWGHAIQQRRAMGQELSRSDGVPARILASEEAAYYKDRIAADPAALVTLATAAGTALGGDGARAFFGELGRAGVAGADLHLAYLAMSPTNANTVRQVVEGRALRAGGARNADFGEADSIVDRSPNFARALSEQPDLLSAVIGIAEDMAIADAARGRVQSADSYLQSALGATNRDGVRFGGMINLNDAATLVPNWLRADRLDDALEVAARGWQASDRGPVYANGRPIPSHLLLGYRLTAMPNGRYRLVNPTTGSDAAARNGQPFEFDIERPAFRDLLARRLPGAVLPEAR